jgi:hypothetical protein
VRVGSVRLCVERVSSVCPTGCWCGHIYADACDTTRHCTTRPTRVIDCRRCHDLLSYLSFTFRMCCVCVCVINRELWKALLETLAQIHNVDHVAVGLETFGRAGGYFTRQVKTLTKVSTAQLGAAPDKVPAIPHFDSIAGILGDHQPTDAVSICHGDFKVSDA